VIPASNVPCRGGIAVYVKGAAEETTTSIHWMVVGPRSPAGTPFPVLPYPTKGYFGCDAMSSVCGAMCGNQLLSKKEPADRGGEG